MGDNTLYQPDLLPPVPEQVQTAELPRPAMPTQQSRRKPTRAVFAAATLMLLAALIAGLVLTNALSANRTVTAVASAAGREGPSVQTIQPTRASLRRTSTQPGTVHPFSEAKVYSRVTGYLKELKVDIGQ